MKQIFKNVANILGLKIKNTGFRIRILWMDFLIFINKIQHKILIWKSARLIFKIVKLNMENNDTIYNTIKDLKMKGEFTEETKKYFIERIDRYDKEMYDAIKDITDLYRNKNIELIEGEVNGK